MSVEENFSYKFFYRHCEERTTVSDEAILLMITRIASSPSRLLAMTGLICILEILHQQFRDIRGGVGAEDAEEVCACGTPACI